MLEGVYVEFLSSCALWNRSCTSVEVPEFGFRYVVGAERLASWTSQGVFCVKFVACSGFTCSFLRRTCGEKQSLCDVLVWRIKGV